MVINTLTSIYTPPPKLFYELPFKGWPVLFVGEELISGPENHLNNKFYNIKPGIFFFRLPSKLDEYYIILNITNYTFKDYYPVSPLKSNYTDIPMIVPTTNQELKTRPQKYALPPAPSAETSLDVNVSGTYFEMTDRMVKSYLFLSYITMLQYTYITYITFTDSVVSFIQSDSKVRQNPIQGSDVTRIWKRLVWRESAAAVIAFY